VAAPVVTAVAARGRRRPGERADAERHAAVVGGGVIRLVLAVQARRARQEDGRRAR
jgi:hypothetical protein